MKKILVSIFVLCIGEQYDVFIPIDMNMMEAVNLIQKSIHELSGEEYIIKKDNEVLLYNDSGKIINLNNTVKFSGLKNGSRILLA